MPKEFVLGLDQGTTGSTAIILDQNGQPFANVNREFPQYFPHAGWVEHDPEEIWTCVSEAINEAIDEAGLKHLDIAAIGITNQRETTVLWERDTGIPVANAIVWQCRRSAGVCQRLRDGGYEPLFRERTGLVLDPYFSGTKLTWYFENDPTLLDRAKRGELCFGTIDSWLLWKFTGQHLTDFTNASRTLMFDIQKRQWDRELLDILGVPESVLPDVRPSVGVFGTTTREVFGDEEIPIRAVAGDQQAALAGHLGFKPGMSKNTYGTGSFIVCNMGSDYPGVAKGLLTTLATDAKGHPQYAFEGSIFSTGSAVQWLRDGLGVIAAAEETEDLARSLTSNDGVYMVPAFVGLGSPYWDSDVRGGIVGLTRGNTRAHLARAVLESIAYQTRDVLDSMRSEGNVDIPVLSVDGGATVNNFLMQFQADILNIPVRRHVVNETTAYGAALLAGVDAGLINLDEVASSTSTGEEYSPKMSENGRENLYAGWQRAVRQLRTR